MFYLLVSGLTLKCNLTLHKMADLPKDPFGVTLHRNTERRTLDGHAFALKKLHSEVDYRNPPANKQKRGDYLIQFYAALVDQMSYTILTRLISIYVAHESVVGARAVADLSKPMLQANGRTST